MKEHCKSDCMKYRYQLLIIMMDKSQSLLYVVVPLRILARASKIILLQSDCLLVF